MAKEKLFNNLSEDQIAKLQALKSLKQEEVAAKKAEVREESVAASTPTNVTPKKSWRALKEEYTHILNWLTENFGNLFNLQEPKPLKRHIEYDLFAKLPEDGSISRKKLRDTLAYYTNTRQYREALLVATHRYDLDGSAVEEIDATHKDYVQDKISQAEERKKQRVQAFHDRRQKRAPHGKTRTVI